MASTNWALHFTCLLFIKGAFSLTVTTSDKTKIVNVGERVQLLCSTTQELDNCRWAIPGEGAFQLKPSKSTSGFSYFGGGLEKGECGVTITSVKEKNNGNVTCSVTSVVGIKEVEAQITLIVAKKPNPPEFSITTGSVSGSNNYLEGDVVSASCTVRDGRPAANISWYIGNDLITDGLSTPEVIVTSESYYTVKRNVTRKVIASDHGKDLKCVIEHPLVDPAKSVAKQQILVKFPPKGFEPMEQFGLEEGADASVHVHVKANPRPSFTWYVDGEGIYEGGTDNSNRFHVLKATEDISQGVGTWDSVLVIKNLVKEDVDRSYELSAKNEFGSQKYTVKISTNPEPKAAELGAGLIVSIVAAVLILLTVAIILVFARAKGRWCFSGPSGPKLAAESSDTESAEHKMGPPPSAAMINESLKAIFKRSHKVAPPQDKSKNGVDDETKGMCPSVEGGPSNDEEKTPKEKGDDGVVYAELDLQNKAPVRGAVKVKVDDDKTEYAEIIHTPDQPSEAK